MSSGLIQRSRNAARPSVTSGQRGWDFRTAINFGGGNGPRSLVVDHFNGYGLRDLAVANYSSNNVSVLINNTPQ